jgi:multidrug transporter EmrE-like cation transporter
MDFVLLAFAVTMPLSTSFGMAFARRERALFSMADFRSCSHHVFLAHCLWDWNDGKEGRVGADADWIEHCDAVLAQLVGIGDELSRFLTLPTTSRGRHRMTRAGRREAAATIEVAYDLLESMTTQRITRLLLYSERLKKLGLNGGEASRLRQYENGLSRCIEQLRMIKMYRTPQAFRSVARVFVLILPPFYAPTYAQLAKDLQSIGMGIAFALLTVVGLSTLFESLTVFEDPFTAFLALDGIDVKEEFEVLHYAQLCNTRRLIFPDAPEYPVERRVALTSRSPQPSHTLPKLGVPPMQSHHFLRGAATSTSSDGGLAISSNRDSSVEDIELGRPIDDNASVTRRETMFALTQ